jgi:hypothetical protein
LINTVATRTKRQSATCGDTSVIIDLEEKISSKNYYNHGTTQFFVSFVTFEVVCDHPAEKRKVGGSTPPLTTSNLHLVSSLTCVYSRKGVSLMTTAAPNQAKIPTDSPQPVRRSAGRISGRADHPTARSRRCREGRDPGEEGQWPGPAHGACGPVPDVTPPAAARSLSWSAGSPSTRPGPRGAAPSAPAHPGATHVRRNGRVIVNEFIIAKTFISYSVNFFRHDKSLRANDDSAG